MCAEPGARQAESANALTSQTQETPSNWSNRKGRKLSGQQLAPTDSRTCMSEGNLLPVINSRFCGQPLRRSQPPAKGQAHTTETRSLRLLKAKKLRAKSHCLGARGPTRGRKRGQEGANPLLKAPQQTLAKTG